MWYFAGKNVREIQRMTGAMIKLPEDPASQQEETIVEIFGNFMQCFVTVARIHLIGPLIFFTQICA